MSFCMKTLYLRSEMLFSNDHELSIHRVIGTLDCKGLFLCMCKRRHVASCTSCYLQPTVKPSTCVCL